MSIELQIRRGSTSENNSFVGKAGELTMDTDKKQLRIHDGSTMGGKVIGGNVEIAPKEFLTAYTTGGRRYLKIKSGTSLAIGTTFYQPQSDYTFSVDDAIDTGTITNGKDYYVYLATNDNSTISVKVSLSTSGPSGYSTYRLIGGFHTECVDVGTISGHPLSGYLAGDVLPASVWCLNHYAANTSLHQHKGLVYNATTDSWCCIYNMSTSGTSEYGAARATKLQHYQYSELARANGFSLLSDEEFYQFSKGSNQQTNISGSAKPSPDTTGGHVDTASRRMVSWLGCEEMCGLQWTHLAEYSSTEGASSWTSQAGNEGSYAGGYVRLAGGPWVDSSRCGSRSRSSYASLSYADPDSYGGTRGQSPCIHVLTDVEI